jgi:hypothetical protein
MSTLKKRKGLTLSELAIALSLTGFIALLAVGLLNMSTKASVMSRQANEAIAYEVGFTEAIKEIEQTKSNIETIPKESFTQSHLNKDWNYIGVMSFSEFGTELTDELLASVGVSGATPIKESFDDGKGNMIEAGNVLVQIKYSGETMPEKPADGIVMQSVVDGVTQYFTAHIMGYDYEDAYGERHLYSLNYTVSGEVGSELLTASFTETIYYQDQEKLGGRYVDVWCEMSTDTKAESSVTANNTLHINDKAGGHGVAIAYQNEPVIPTTEAPTEPSTEATTEATTEAPTEPSTEAPTEPSTEAATVAPTTQAPTTVAPKPTTTAAPTTTVAETKYRTSYYDADFTVAILMDVSSFRDDHSLTAYQARMSDLMTNKVSRFVNMKNTVNDLLTKLSKYKYGNVILIPYSYVGAADANFGSGARPSMLVYNTAGDVTTAKSIVSGLKLDGGSNPGDALRVLYDELNKIEQSGGNVGELSIIMFAGREMGSWSTTSKTTSDGLSTTAAGSQYYLADKTKAGYNPWADTYPAYVRTNYFYWENGYYDAQWWHYSSATWVADGFSIGRSSSYSSVNEYDPSNKLALSKEQYTKERLVNPGDTMVGQFRPAQQSLARNYMIKQLSLIRRDYTISKYTSGGTQKENIYLVALWAIEQKQAEKAAYQKAGFTIINSGNDLPTDKINSAFSNITSRIDAINSAINK